MHTLAEDKGDHSNDSFYEELQCLLNQFLKYYAKVFSG
jgi:hypothetical protein